MRSALVPLFSRGVLDGVRSLCFRRPFIAPRWASAFALISTRGRFGFSSMSSRGSSNSRSQRGSKTAERDSKMPATAAELEKRKAALAKELQRKKSAITRELDKTKAAKKREMDRVRRSVQTQEKLAQKELQKERDKQMREKRRAEKALTLVKEKAAAKKEKEKAKKVPRAKSAMNYFMTDVSSAVRAQNAGAAPTEILKQMVTKWKGLNDGEREKYKQLAAADLERAKKERAAKKAASGRKPSAYTKFFLEKRPSVVQKMPSASFGDVGRELGRMWTALSQEEKDKYKKAVSVQAKGHAKA